MGKKISEMGLEELWQLFPIYLTVHNDNWSVWYTDEERHLKDYFPADRMKRISHIGNMAIKGIWAKPIIDILAEVVPECDLQQVKPILGKAGYLCMSENSGRLSFNKGYTENGFAERVFHLHLRKAGDNKRPRSNLKIDMRLRRGIRITIRRSSEDAPTLYIKTNMFAYDCPNPVKPHVRTDGELHRCVAEDIDELVEFMDLFHRETGVD